MGRPPKPVCKICRNRVCMTKIPYVVDEKGENHQRHKVGAGSETPWITDKTCPDGNSNPGHPLRGQAGLTSLNKA